MSNLKAGILLASLFAAVLSLALYGIHEDNQAYLRCEKMCSPHTGRPIQGGLCRCNLLEEVRGID